MGPVRYLTAGNSIAHSLVIKRSHLLVFKRFRGQQDPPLPKVLGSSFTMMVPALLSCPGAAFLSFPSRWFLDLGFLPLVCFYYTREKRICILAN